MEQAYETFLDTIKSTSKDLSWFSLELPSLFKMDFSMPAFGFGLGEKAGTLFNSAHDSMAKNVEDALEQLTYLGSTISDLAVLIFSKRATRHMTFFLLFNVIVMFLEYHIGHTRNSAGLMSDATHMLNDNLALMIGIVATAASR